jgi:hypothetical protein
MERPSTANAAHPPASAAVAMLVAVKASSFHTIYRRFSTGA